MPSTLLLTSVPPLFSKNNKELIDPKKLEWQSLCYKSWISSGHHIVSLNSEFEVEHLKPLFPDINFVNATRTTQAENGRPLIYISDAINFGKIQKFKRIAICNADVIITGNLDKNSITNSKIPIIYSNRINIDSTNSASGTVFGGIDYFNLSRSFCDLLPESAFAFGLPWWDYWIPTVAINLGLKLYRAVNEIGNPILLHKNHSEVWNPNDFHALGTHYFDNLFNPLTTKMSCSTLSNLYKNSHSNPICNEKMQLLAIYAQNTSKYINENSITYFV